MFRTLFAEDAHIDFVCSIGVEGSRDQIAEWLSVALGMMEFIQHYITNIESEVTGNTATARAMFYTPVPRSAGAEAELHGRLLPPVAGAHRC